MKCPFVLLLFASTPAFGGDPYMWGIGPRVQASVFLPPRSIELGAEAAFFVNRNVNVGFMAVASTGSRQVDLGLLTQVDWVAPIGVAGFSIGGGVGINRQWVWNSSRDRRNSTTIPVRSTLGVLGRDGTRLVHFRTFLQYDVPVVQSQRLPSNGLRPFTMAHFLTSGFEVTVLWGDFTPPRKPKSMDGLPLRVDDPMP